jgi:hypothetical protein
LPHWTTTTERARWPFAETKTSARAQDDLKASNHSLFNIRGQTGAKQRHVRPRHGYIGHVVTRAEWRVVHERCIIEQRGGRCDGVDCSAVGQHASVDGEHAVLEKCQSGAQHCGNRADCQIGADCSPSNACISRLPELRVQQIREIRVVVKRRLRENGVWATNKGRRVQPREHVAEIQRRCSRRCGAASGRCCCTNYSCWRR